MIVVMASKTSVFYRSVLLSLKPETTSRDRAIDPMRLYRVPTAQACLGTLLA
jgi:hypothetical protein